MTSITNRLSWGAESIKPRPGYGETGARYFLPPVLMAILKEWPRIDLEASGQRRDRVLVQRAVAGHHPLLIVEAERTDVFIHGSAFGLLD